MHISGLELLALSVTAAGALREEVRIGMCVKNSW